MKILGLTSCLMTTAWMLFRRMMLKYIQPYTLSSLPCMCHPTLYFFLLSESAFEQKRHRSELSSECIVSGERAVHFIFMCKCHVTESGRSFASVDANISVTHSSKQLPHKRHFCGHPLETPLMQALGVLLLQVS